MSTARKQTEDGCITVTNPYDGCVLARIPTAKFAEVDLALANAQSASRVSRDLSRAQRGDILDKMATLLESDAEDAARLIVRESGKTIRQARKEVRRTANTLRLSAVEARRLAGEMIPFDSFPGNEGRTGYFTREPLGVIAAITPYNDPLNLVAHKIGPAIAAGNAIVLKPSELAPLSAMRLSDLADAAGLPLGILSVINGGQAVAARLVCDERVRLVSFTGGFETADKIVRTAGAKRYTMELGGNAPIIVMADCDLAAAVESSVSGAFWAAGQNCIGVQRILVETSLMESFTEAFVDRTRRLVVGNPMREDTDMGPMIGAEHAHRVLDLVGQAVREGAVLLTGGTSKGNCVDPTVLTNVPRSSALFREEVFGPVVMIEPVADIEAALACANDCDVGLHAAIFTRGLDDALQAAKRLEAGGVMINDSSDFRLDAMPFGGFKKSSIGREGVRFAVEEMSQTKVVMFAAPVSP
jgi:acyl-CoA reductase-like NAD-dependent aldehyde dehydrogenase